MANSNASEPAGAGWRATVLSVLLVAAVVAIPLFLLRSLVHERIELKSRAQANANESWGGPQTIDGPALEIPLTAEGISAGRIVLLPQSLDASAELSVERRSRGLFQALIYEAKIMAAQSDKRSPNRLSVRMTSNCLGRRTNCIAQLSAYICSSSTSA